MTHDNLVRADVMSPNSITAHCSEQDERIRCDPCERVSMNDEEMHCAAVRTRFNVNDRQQTPSQHMLPCEGVSQQILKLFILPCMSPRVKQHSRSGERTAAATMREKAKKADTESGTSLKHLERSPRSWKGKHRCWVNRAGGSKSCSPKTDPQKKQCQQQCQRP